MARFLDRQMQRVSMYFEETEGADVVGPLDGVLEITRCTTAAEVRAKISAEGLGGLDGILPRPVAELEYRFLAYDQGTFSVLSSAQESDTERPVLGPRFAWKNEENGNWCLMLRGHGMLSRVRALDPAQRDVLRGELERPVGGGGETKGDTDGSAGIVGEIADILEDLHEEGTQQRT